MSPPSRCVFVGNIPWDATDESMAELFQEAGPLVSFRLVTDKETLKPKGYGFAEYHDIETAKCAVRNLNDLDLGGRKLRVDFAESDTAAKSLGLELPRPPVTASTTLSTSTQAPPLTRSSSITPPLSQHSKAPQPHSTSATPTPTPATTPVPVTMTSAPTPSPSFQPNQPATDAISSVISGMTKEKLTEVLTNVKLLSTTQPEQVRALLSGNPQLTYCLMQMMLVCGLVDPTAIQNIVKNVAAAPSPPAPVPLNPAPPAYPPSGTPAQMDPRLSAQPISIPNAQPNNVLPLPYNSVPIENTLAAMTVQQRQALMQVFSLTPSHIEALPPDQKATIMQLRAQFPHFFNLTQPPI